MLVNLVQLLGLLVQAVGCLNQQVKRNQIRRVAVMLGNRAPPLYKFLHILLIGFVLEFICLISDYGNNAVFQTIVNLSVKPLQQLVINLIGDTNTNVRNTRCGKILGSLGVVVHFTLPCL